MNRHPINKGDTARTFYDGLTLNGQLIDLTGATVDFVLRELKTGEIIRQEATPLIPSQTIVIQGKSYKVNVKYKPGTADVDTPGEYGQQWEIDWGNGDKLTIPQGDPPKNYNVISIVEKLDP